MITRTGDVVTISGNLTLDTAREAASTLFNGGSHIASGEKLAVDLSSIEAFDSSAVGVLLQWTRLAREKGVQLSFINLPDNLKNLADLYEVTDLLVTQ